MGLHKRCSHKGRARDRCEHVWHGSFQHRRRLHRVSLGKWANEDVKTKAHAQVIYERFRGAVRAGRFAAEGEQPASAGMTFNALADLYVERYVTPNALSSADTIDSRLTPLRAQFGLTLLCDIRTADVEDFVARLKTPTTFAPHHKTPRVRRPATINRYLSLLRHMFNWAVAREYLERTPFRRGNATLIHQEPEDNRRHRRITAEEERALLAAAAPHLKILIITALDTGMRRGEMLALTWADIEARPGWLRLRGETTKSGKTRWVPIATARLQAVLTFLRLDAAGERKPAPAPVFSNAVGEPIRFFQTAWKAAQLRGHGFEPKRAGEKGARRVGRLAPACHEALRRIDLRWHDLRHEYASRLAERGTPLSQIRDLLGHHSIVTTERYDTQTQDALMAAAKRLETGETFTLVSHEGVQEASSEVEQAGDNSPNLLPDDDLEVGVDDGVRTRDFRSHSPALCH
jgi:integrase